MTRALVLAAALAAGSALGDGAPERGPELFVDVRTPEEFAGGRVPGAVNIPIQEFAARLAELPRDRDLVVYCERGGRAQRAMQLLEAAGYTRVRELEGSMSAWRAAGRPVER